MFNMKKKDIKYINIVYLGIFIIGILAAVFIMLFDNNVETKKPINPNEFKVEIYENMENRVMDYSKFFSIENILIDIFEEIENEKYQSVYNLLSEEYKKILSIEQFTELVKDYMQFNVNYINVHSRNSTKGRLNFLYEIENQKYLCDADLAIVDNNINIVISIIGNHYEISYFSILRGRENG